MTRISLDLVLECPQFGCLHRICKEVANALSSLSLSSLNYCSKRLFNPVCFTFVMAFVLCSLHSY